MKVILLENIENLGKKYDIKEVASGYARNFLFPKNLAKLADEENLKWLENQEKTKSQEEEQELKRIQELASQVDGLEVQMPIKIGEKGQLFEAITPQKISEKLKEMGFDVKKTRINLLEPIKEVGEFPVKINFEHNLEANIKVVIIEEK